MSIWRPGQGVAEPPPSLPHSSPRVVVEFAGTPRAGKTSATHGLAERLRARGRSVLLVDGEPATDPPLPTRHPHFNLWAAHATSARMIEAMYAPVDVVLVDKGLFDALCWMHWHRSKDYLTPDDHQAVDGFLRVASLRVASLRKLIHVVFVMTVEPAVGVERERASWPPGEIYEELTVVNTDTLRELNRSIARMVKRHHGEFNLHEVDTTNLSREQTLERIAGVVESLVLA